MKCILSLVALCLISCANKTEGKVWKIELVDHQVITLPCAPNTIGVVCRFERAGLEEIVPYQRIVRIWEEYKSLDREE